MGLEGGGFLYGSTGSNGLFSGPRIAYIYPGKVKNFEFQILNQMWPSILEIRASLAYIIFVAPFSK